MHKQKYKEVGCLERHIFNVVQRMKDKVVFSMPGHKSKDIFDFDYKNDITETVSTDNLLNPNGCILKSQQEIAEIYGVKRTYYVENGSTGALNIAISAVTNPNDHVLIQRNCHKSVYNSLVINDLVPSYVYANYNNKYNLITGIDPEDIRRQLEKDLMIKAVVLVSPNYFGVCLKLKEIADIVHKFNAYLIVDEAHGSHMAFSEKLREYSAINCGADIIVHSTHKTIPSLTQTALLHVNNDEISHRKIINRMNLVSSTSPSYLLMQSSEFAVSYMQEHGAKRLAENSEFIKKMKENLKGQVKFFDGDKNDDTIACVDDSKILMRIDGYTGFDVVKKLFMSYNIRLEMGDLYYVLALSSVVDEKDDFKILESALKNLYKNIDEICEVKSINIIKPGLITTPRKAYYSASEEVDIKDAIGRVSASIIAAYPPGIPVVSYGELITEKIVEEILNYENVGIEVVGIADNKVEVIL